MTASDATPPLLQTLRTTLRRKAERGSHERERVLSIIDEALYCHVAFVEQGVARVLPTAHARIGDTLYLHGSPGNHMLRALLQSAQASATFTLIDGLVFARSAIHHSMNYRSVVVFGAPSAVTSLEEKRAALGALVQRAAPGRMDEVRAPSPMELQRTLVVRVPIAEASAKARTGPPIDDEADLVGGAWAGELPLRMVAEPIRRDPLLSPATLVPRAVAVRVDTLAPAHVRPAEWRRGQHIVSTDRSRLDFALVHGFLSERSYWARGVTRAALQRAIDHSFCFGLYRDGAQLGFARVTSDLTRIAYLADVFVLEPDRAQGLGGWLVECVLAHPDLQGIKTWLLGTRDAHRFYERFGFRRDDQDRFMGRSAG
jgi:nitroimidazol reductase NimA-like FMN-containing flavoprotein (pyridoxamine 5'-phosphate oxidase superfamily)/GNAT superfamily N-acetyltransferase